MRSSGVRPARVVEGFGRAGRDRRRGPRPAVRRDHRPRAGMVVDADLALSVATVKTYRNRAFNRLGIHFRSELFVRVLGRDG